MPEYTGLSEIYLEKIARTFNDSKDISEQQKELVKQELDDYSEKIEDLTRKDLNRRIAFRTGLFCVILLLFVGSYLFLMYAFLSVFSSELELINNGILPPDLRSINSTVITSLIAGTITQVGLSFYWVTKFLFQKENNN